MIRVRTELRWRAKKLARAGVAFGVLQRFADDGEGMVRAERGRHLPDEGDGCLAVVRHGIGDVVQ